MLLSVAARTFERYAAGAYNVNNLSDLSRLQADLAAWQGRNFKTPTLEQLALGVGEEVGEMQHAILKHVQGIRGMADRDAFLVAVGDAIGDACIYMMQLCTMLRLDFQAIVAETAHAVLKRDWKANPETGISEERAP